MKPGSKEFAKLQKKWYDKLEKEGFEDIEWVDHKTGRGHNTSYLKDSACNTWRHYNPEAEDYYRICRNFLTHYKFESRLDYWMFKLHSEGWSYRKIARFITRRKDWFKKSRSYFYVFHHVRRLKRTMYEWNRTDDEGLNNPWSTDLHINDFLISKEHDYEEDEG